MKYYVLSRSIGKILAEDQDGAELLLHGKTIVKKLVHGVHESAPFYLT